MKKIYLFLIALAAISGQSLAYDFYADAPSGQRLYYNIVDGNAQVTFQNSSSPSYTNLTGSLTIPSNVTYNGTNYSVSSIGNAAFQGCSGLTAATIPSSVIHIDSNAFKGCSGLASVTIPNSVTAIRYAALSNCTGLTTVTIGNSVTSIGNSAFYGCWDLTSVYYTSDVAGWCGITFDNSFSNPLRYAHNLYINDTLVTNLIIPSSVTEIKNYTFYGAACFTSLDIPASVTSIGEFVFSECRGLTTATIGNSVTSIGQYAFDNCRGLTSLTIGNSVTSIGEKAFIFCSSLTSLTIPNSVTSIGRYAFESCSGLIEIRSLNSVPTSTINGFYDVPSNIPVYIPCGSLSAYSRTNGWSGFTNFIESSFPGFTARSANDSMGYVQIITMPTCSSSQAEISATANSGYRFTHWQDGNTQSTRTITVTGDTTFTAYFEIIPTYTLTVLSDNTSMGSVTGGGTFMEGSTVTISATANSGYRFTHWQDGNTQSTRTITVTGDTTFTAYFEIIPMYTLTVLPENTSMGSVTGGGTFMEGSTVTISATANIGYRFNHWQDGNTSNPRTVTVMDNASYTAFFEAIFYTVTVLSDNASMGSVTGDGTFMEGTSDTIQATANGGYRFAHWQDGDTSNPRIVTVMGNASYTAYFDTIFYTITALSNNTSMGSVSGSGSYASGSTATLTASANSGYRFDHWQDGNTSNPRIITVTDNASYTAYFEAISYTVTALSENASMGSVSGSGSYPFGTTATLTATANSGYRFTHWQDGDTSNPRIVTVTDNASYTAYFEVIPLYTLTVLSDNTSMGSVTGGGTFMEGSTVTILATGNSGYRFVHWQDGNTQSTRTITVTGDTTFTAYFEAIMYTLTVVSGNTSMGSVTGGGSYVLGSIAILTATANSGYQFAHWQDGNTQRTRTITVTGDTTFTAYFEAIPMYTITVLSDNTTMGNATGGGLYSYGRSITLTATANPGYHFTQWQDGNTTNPRTVAVTGGATYTAYFEANTAYYTIDIVAANSWMGSTYGSGVYAAGTTVTIGADPLDGYMFDYWQDGNTQPSRTITVVGDATYTAYFYVPQGIDDVEGTSIKIYARGSAIVIEGADKYDALVYDIMGRIVHRGRIEGPIHVNAMGVYMVKVGDRPARKVVVR